VILHDGRELSNLWYSGAFRIPLREMAPTRNHMYYDSQITISAQAPDVMIDIDLVLCNT